MLRRRQLTDDKLLKQKIAQPPQQRFTANSLSWVQLQSMLVFPSFLSLIKDSQLNVSSSQYSRIHKNQNVSIVQHWLYPSHNIAKPQK